MMHPLPPLLPAVDQPAAVDVRAGERLELDASDGVGAFNAVNLAYQSNLVAMLTGHGPIDYPRVIAIIHACSPTSASACSSTPPSPELWESLPDNHRVAAFFALLEGSLHWKELAQRLQDAFFSTVPERPSTAHRNNELPRGHRIRRPAGRSSQPGMDQRIISAVGSSEQRVRSLGDSRLQQVLAPLFRYQSSR